MPERAMRRAGWLLALLLVLLCGTARADGCSVAMTDVVFTPASTINTAGNAVTATARVTCTWDALNLGTGLALFPEVSVCLGLGPGTNASSYTARNLYNAASGVSIPYNLYRDAARTQPWGSVAQGASINIAMSRGSGTGVASRFTDVTIYGFIPYSSSIATTVPTAINSTATYSASFAAATTMNYSFFLSGVQLCTLGGTGSFPFQVKADISSDCTITADPLSFGSAAVLSAPVRSTAAIRVLCSKGAAYQIALNGGAVANNVAGRQMQNLSNGSERISYSLSGSLDGPVWGDGSAGTQTVGGTGTGSQGTVTIYGMVPAQSTPSPADYKDTVTATITF
jgi:spore coat protein U-like protein